MRCYELSNFTPDGLRAAIRSRPVSGSGQVLLRIEAASLNYRDLMIASGAFPLPTPFIPVSDGAGVIVEVGEGVEGVTVGDRVCPMFLQGWQTGSKAHLFPPASPLGGPLDGVLREYAVFPAVNVVKAPGHLSAVEAATLPTAALTAWKVLSSANVRPGDTVLVQGTGGVSVFALQFSKLMGARVIVVSSSESKLKRARELGCDATIDRRAHPEWGEVAFAQSAGGVDIVVDIGGQATLRQACKAIREGGFVAAVGALGGFSPALDGLEIVFKQIRLQGFVAGNRQDFVEMCAAIGQHRLRPVVDREFEFEDAPQAYRYLEAAQHVGKVAITI